MLLTIKNKLMNGGIGAELEIFGPPPNIFRAPTTKKLYLIIIIKLKKIASFKKQLKISKYV